MTGTVNDVILTRQISDDNPVAIQLTYDLAKLWRIVKPMLPPSQQQSLADLKISGQQQRTFTVTGSYPADKPFNEAVAMIRVGGFFTVDNLSTQGITIQNLDVPLCVKDGVLRTVYADQPEGQNAPKPAICNQGTLDIGVLSVDLRSDPMLLTMEGAAPNRPHDLLRDVSLNPAMAKTFMGKILNNPAFVNASDSRTGQRLGLAVASHSAERPGAAGVAAESGICRSAIFGARIADRQRAAGGVRQFISVGRNRPCRREVAERPGDGRHDADDRSEQAAAFRGRGDPGVGAVCADDGVHSVGAVSRLVPANVRGYVPDQVIVPLEGDMNHPKLKLDKAIAETIKKGAGKAIMNGLLQGLSGAGRR